MLHGHRSIRAALVIVAISILATAAAGHEGGMECPHPGATIESLRHCVEHAASMGMIDEAGVLNSLLAKLDAAQSALDRGQPDTAAEILNAFIHEVEAQAGQHIEAEHAAHMLHHAEHVIEAL